MTSKYDGNAFETSLLFWEIILIAYWSVNEFCAALQLTSNVTQLLTSLLHSSKGSLFIYFGHHKCINCIIVSYNAMRQMLLFISPAGIAMRNISVKHTKLRKCVKTIVECDINCDVTEDVLFIFNYRIFKTTSCFCCQNCRIFYSFQQFLC